ncbi:hypothetical protein SEA_NICHOLAS_87 [Mycobacterium phage Nicholas]|nr:hypothetical protein SEA_KINGSOLOMON_87 [Mycobacterium phage Kingsolomon]ASR87358.1 hypothetical protein SEA_NICHOLAS_87 [Mycobacterium phage Nicholas]AYB70441.1 hypothetical protein SEA_SAMTY_88 [Mycobacterium phage Samty]QDK03619.1 hypothetical protein SEA_FINNRY_89 [Mycobacterium phage Finnry]
MATVLIGAMVGVLFLLIIPAIVVGLLVLIRDLFR